MSNYKVSVVIPVYNREKKIKRAISSALSQTHFNLEVLVVDDGSTDNTVECAKKFSDKRLSVISLNRNHGVSRARNEGISKSNGKFISFLDSDDEWREYKLERQLRYIEESNRKLDIVDCDWYTNIKSVEKNVLKEKDGPTNRIKLLSFQHICSPSTVIVRRGALEETGGFDESIPTAEDADLWVRLSEKYEFGHVSEPLVEIHRGHKETLGLDTQSFIEGHARFYNKHKEKYEGLKNIESKFFCKVGRTLISNGDNHEGRKFLIRSIINWPFLFRSYPLLALSFLSSSSHDKLSFLKRLAQNNSLKVGW